MSGFSPSSLSRSISLTSSSFSFRLPVAVPLPVVVVVSLPGVTVGWVMAVEPSGFFSTVGGVVVSTMGSAPGLGFVSTLVSDFSVFSAVPITTSSGFFCSGSFSSGSFSSGFISSGSVLPPSGSGLGSVLPLSGLGLVSPLSGLGLVSPLPGLGLGSGFGLVTITPSSFWEPSGLVVGFLLYLTSASFRVS